MSLQKKKVFFVCSSYDGTPLDGAEFIDKISKKLDTLGIETCGVVTHFKEVKDYFDARNLPCYYLPDFKEKYPIKNLEAELTEIEKKYDITLEKIIVGDFDYNHSNRRKAEEMLLHVFRFWEDVVDKYDLDYVIGGEQRYLNLVGHAVCRKKKAKYLALMRAPFPNTFVLSRDVCGYMTTLQRYWEKNRDKPITAEERRKAEDYIQSILSKEKKNEAFNLYDTTPKINAAKIRFFITRAYKSFFVDRLRTPYSKPWRGLYNYVMRIIRSKVARLLYDRPHKGEKYIFFPLHIEWDSPIIVWNPLFINQLYIIQHISRNLPYGYKLYVKEHPCDTGGTKIRQLYNIKKTRAVRLINPSVDSFELERNAEAIIVIAGTVGWEGLLINKPVINVGRAYYEISDLTWKVCDLSKLDEVIKKALTENRYDRETLLRFITAFMKVSYTGKIGFSQLYYGNESNRDIVLSDENITAVSEGIKKQITEDAYLLD